MGTCRIFNYLINRIVREFTAVPSGAAVEFGKYKEHYEEKLGVSDLEKMLRVHGGFFGFL